MPYVQLEDLSYCALSLSDYASIIGYDECAFWGVYYDGQIDYDCRMFWTEWQRMDLYRALQEAQKLIESVVGYPLCRTWIEGSPSQFQDQTYTDLQPVANPVTLRWGSFISAGVRATATLEAASPVNLATDPAIVGPIACTISSAEEVKIYYPGTLREISPSAMIYNSGNLTIYIPRCRLTVTPNTIDEGVDYNVLSNFLTTVDVVRVYNDPSVGATLVAPHRCTALCASGGCGEYTTTACIYPRDKRLGIVDLIPAAYSGGEWVDSSPDRCLRDYEFARLNYLAGMNHVDFAMKSAIIRLAHARMASEPCRCAIVQKLWERDRTIPAVLTRERINCPFGMNEGAWTAYKYAQTKKLYRMGIL